jgi:hypothetical protein
MKMGRRLGCSSVTYRFRYAPRPARIPTRNTSCNDVGGLREALRAGRALPAAHFDRNATTPVTDLVALGGRELSSVRRDHVCACGFGFWYR